MTVKDRVLDALEANRGTWFSGEALAQTLGVSRSAVWKAVSQLREGGYPIRAASNRGYSLEADSAILSAQSVGKYLTAPGVTVEVRPTVTSTNDLLRQQAEAGAGVRLDEEQDRATHVIGLLDAERRECDVRLALVAAEHIPLGLAMAHKNDLCHRNSPIHPESIQK